MIRLKTRTPLALAAFLCAFAVNADSTEAENLLAANSYAVELDADELVGPGADLILQLAENAQFVALGEEHHNLFIPAITTSLFSELQELYGFSYFMTEQDPVMMEVMSRPPVRGDQEKINDLARRYPMGITFNSDEELKMIADIGRISNAEFDVIWGCDQAAGVTHILDQLALEMGDAASLAYVESKRDEAALQEPDRNYKTSHFISGADSSWFAEILSAVDPEPDSQAAWLIDVLIQSNQIFGYYYQGERGLLPGFYENNRYREEHLKDLCLDKYRVAEQAAVQPKALMKFGSWHLYEGLSPTRIHTIGDFFSNVARFNGNEFLSINFISMPDDPEASMARIGYAWPFVRDLDPGSFAIIDLRPFRSYPNLALLEKSVGQEWFDEYRGDYIRLVYGYDLLFFVGTTRTANFRVVPALD